MTLSAKNFSDAIKMDSTNMSPDSCVMCLHQYLLYRIDPEAVATN